MKCKFQEKKMDQNVSWYFLLWKLCSLTVGAVCNFLSSVSSQQKFEVKYGPLLQLCVISSDGSVLQLSFI